MKQPHLTKETAKARIRFSTLFENEDFAPKSSRFRERKKHNNETDTGYKRCEIAIKKLGRYRRSSPPENRFENFQFCCVPLCALINKDVHADHSGNSY